MSTLTNTAIRGNALVEVAPRSAPVIHFRSLKRTDFERQPDFTYEKTLTGDEWIGHLPLSFCTRHDLNNDGVDDVQANYSLIFSDDNGNGRIDAGDTFTCEQPDIRNLRTGCATAWSEADTVADLAKLNSDFYRHGA